jgi:hypothetical protein
VPENSGILVFAILPPDMNTHLLTPLKRLARNKHLRVVRESTRKIFQILQMLVVRMVTIKPRKVRKIFRLILAYRSKTTTSAQPPQK